MLALGLTPVGAQIALASPATDEKRITLTPFTVSAEKDVGFVAASSLAGGRIATALKDTLVAYSVITAEFLEAFNLTDVAEATQWSVNSSVVDADGTQRAFGTSVGNGGLRTRGLAAGLPTRNFFPYVVTADSYNLDRVDFGRGPNAVLFGAGGVGGTVNSVTKQADPRRRFRVRGFRSAVTTGIGFPVTSTSPSTRPGEDITSPARYAVPGNLTYLIPRNYTLSAKLNF